MLELPAIILVFVSIFGFLNHKFLKLPLTVGLVLIALISGIGVLIIGVVFATSFFINSNKKDLTLYETVQLSKATIETKIVATGKVIPEDEVEIKPQIAGIVEKILVEEGDKVKAGDLLVKIKVVPNEQTLNSAEGRVKNFRIVLDNSETEFNRNIKQKMVFDKVKVQT